MTSNNEVKNLPQRAQTILGDVVELYTETGTPVGSKTLCERTGLKLSPASIRNVMSELESKGYLESPHTSAGRVPTEKGFRYFAKSIVEVDGLDQKLKDQIDSQITENKSFKEVVADVSQTLEQITSCASLMVAPRLEMASLEQIEFVRLDHNRVLAVLVTKDGDIENRMIDVPNGIDTDQLNESAKHLKEVVEGRTVSDARVAMMQELMEHKSQVDSLMDQMLVAADQWGEAQGTDSALVVSGSKNLFQYPELVRDQLQELFHAFEEKRMLMALMNEVQKGEGVQIFIGDDCPFESVTDCAMITSSYGTGDRKVMGTLGVIGPMRMDYKKTIQLVDYTGQVLSNLLESKNQAELEETI